MFTVITSLDLNDDKIGFAIVMWEIVTREEPFANVNYYRIQELVLQQNLRPSFAENFLCHPELRKLITSCWDNNMEKRLPFTEIVDALKRLLASGEITDDVNKK